MIKPRQTGAASWISAVDAPSSPTDAYLSHDDCALYFVGEAMRLNAYFGVWKVSANFLPIQKNQTHRKAVIVHALIVDAIGLFQHALPYKRLRACSKSFKQQSAKYQMHALYARIAPALAVFP